ncbi:MAG: hypothetical protein AAGE86_00350 [Pseudomonadota bacterium]
MTNLQRLPLALAALGASSPALAHEANFFHTHSEGLVAGAAIAIAVAGMIGWKMLRSRSK